MSKIKRIRMLETKVDALIRFLDARPITLGILADREGVPLFHLNPNEFSHFEKINRCKHCGGEEKCQR
jgi:hypothetical protein